MTLTPIKKISQFSALNRKSQIYISQ